MAPPNPPLVPRRDEVIRRHRSSGGRLAAVLPIHYSRAVFRAHRMLPVEVWGPPGIDTSPGDAHLQSYTCGIVRSSLAFVLSGGLDVADIIVVPHGCDSLQGLGSVLLDFAKPRQPVATLYVPRGPRSASVVFLAEELRALSRRLSEISGIEPTLDELRQAIAREESADRALADLLDARPHLPFADADFYRVARAREYLPAEDFEPLARAMLAERVAAKRPGIPVVLSGLVPEPMNFLGAVADAGGVIVGDDLACLGRRRYAPGRSDDPWKHLAESLLDAPPDSTRGSSTADRLAWIEKLATDSGAKAVVFYLVKFCEPELFYLPQLRQGLEERGLKSVVIETDIAESLSHQAVTRLEALLESVS